MGWYKSMGWIGSSEVWDAIQEDNEKAKEAEQKDSSKTEEKEIDE